MNTKEKGIIEAILFSAAEPVLALDISLALNIDEETVKEILAKMQEEYEREDSGITLLKLESSYQLCSKGAYFEYIAKLFEPKRKQELSLASLETLAVIAYNQPVTRSSIEFIRGVNSDGAVSKLVERGLIEECGRLQRPGKPLLYKTTDAFLRSFGLSSLDELPNIDHIPLSTVQRNV